jgi:serine palmitoyltransferase
MTLKHSTQQNGHISYEKPHTPNNSHRKDSYEQPSIHTACLTYFGFYLLMLLGYVNQLFFTPNVAAEKNRDVSTAIGFH